MALGLLEHAKCSKLGLACGKCSIDIGTFLFHYHHYLPGAKMSWSGLPSLLARALLWTKAYRPRALLGHDPREAGRGGKEGGMIHTWM